MLKNRLFIVVAGNPWDLLGSGTVVEAMHSLYRDNKQERKLLLCWDMMEGVQVYGAVTPHLTMDAHQARLPGLEILSPTDQVGLFQAVHDAVTGLFKVEEK